MLTAELQRRLKELDKPEGQSMLAGIRRGIEKESLRVSPEGHLAQTPHPAHLGSALSHDYITTDYSEALLEFITPAFDKIEQALETLEDIHRFTYSQMDTELLWGASMPCVLEGDENIPVAEYGTSNVGRMKKVYRYGLGHRYGRLMQTIAGIHYNFSMPAEYWSFAQAADGDERELQDYITDRYLGLIRNFQRYYWLLIYLFGASPAVCKSFVRNHPEHGLEPFDENSKSLHLPYATSLRMGDLGYQSNAQKDLSICYNALSSYIETLHRAITQPHPAYEAVGIGENHDRQLNTSLLQIENEFYSPIRPKRVTRSGETPLCALQEQGIEYIEVRCIDVNPFHSLGIDAEQIRFMDAFLVFCLLQDSPACNDAEQARINENVQRIVNRGREPGLQLQSPEGEVSMTSWAKQLMSGIKPIVELLENAHGASDEYTQSYQAQLAKIDNPALTPSARVLNEMAEQDVPFFRLAMNYSLKWSEEFRDKPLGPHRQAHFEQASEDSRQRQSDIEAAPAPSFEEYLASYYAQYERLTDK